MGWLDEKPSGELLQFAQELGLPVGMGTPAEVKRAVHSALYDR